MAEAPLINMDEAVEAWAKITVDKFHEALDEHEIGLLDGDLWRSIAFELARNGGNIEEVIFKLRAYGRFVDMGVGRGVPIGGKGSSAFEKSRKDNGQLHQYGRKPKHWYSTTKTREVAILRLVLVSKYGQKSLAAIEGAFPKIETVNI